MNRILASQPCFFLLACFMPRVFHERQVRSPAPALSAAYFTHRRRVALYSTVRCRDLAELKAQREVVCRSVQVTCAVSVCACACTWYVRGVPAKYSEAVHCWISCLE